MLSMISIPSAYEQHSRSRFPLPREDQAAAFERRLGVAFPRAFEFISYFQLADDKDEFFGLLRDNAD